MSGGGAAPGPGSGSSPAACRGAHYFVLCGIDADSGLEPDELAGKAGLRRRRVLLRDAGDAARTRGRRGTGFRQSQLPAALALRPAGFWGRDLMTLLFIPRAGCAAEPSGVRPGFRLAGAGLLITVAGAGEGAAPRARPGPSMPAPSPAAARGGSG